MVNAWRNVVKTIDCEYVREEIGESKLEEFMHIMDSKANSGRKNKIIKKP